MVDITRLLSFLILNFEFLILDHLPYGNHTSVSHGFDEIGAGCVVGHVDLGLYGRSVPARL